MNTPARRFVGFSGHMTDAPDRKSPRFPEAHVEAVGRRLRAVLEKEPRPLHGVSSAARGGDLEFLKQLLALGGTASVLLPFPAPGFKQTSVGQGWNDTFDRLLAHPAVTVYPPLHAAMPTSEDAQAAAFEACNVQIVDTLIELAAKGRDAAPLFLSVFHDAGARQQGGTWDAIERWRKRGGHVEIIDPMALPL